MKYHSWGDVIRRIISLEDTVLSLLFLLVELCGNEVKNYEVFQRAKEVYAQKVSHATNL